MACRPTQYRVGCGTREDIDMRADSTEYVHIPILSDVDITDDTVEVGFTPIKGGDPETWYPGIHETGGVKLLVGPEDGIDLGEGIWFLVVRVTDNPEVPVLNAGRLTLT